MGETDNEKAPANGSNSVVVPSPWINMNVRSFLMKTYDMVDDPATDRLVSWGPMNNSFIVKDQDEFVRDLLPKYFKHNNFSSFYRQLYSYGFQRVDPILLEFKNEYFLKGQRHLLSSIVRREYAAQKQKPWDAHGQSSTADMGAEVGEFGLDEEVERLKGDMNVVNQELVKLKQQQEQTIDTQLQSMLQRLHGMEQRQQKMMLCLPTAVNNPEFEAHFVQKQKESSGPISEGNKKRKFKSDIPDNHLATPADGQIFNYEPFANDGSAAAIDSSLPMDENMLPAIDSSSPNSDSVWDSSLIDEILNSIDPSVGQFPVPSPLATDAEMDSTQPVAPQQISDEQPENRGSDLISSSTKEA